ncbi:PREDICTED: uncharacterized protein LOC108556599 [Nicrophorus vespilloides]|uniref:Uncharacterized protein LOC108556599 n=1 Tax=Nicrophorus vespilloides TaxID=110193 RepID=A0ABM1M109_NICVS|nr:PREDICTED: uncharacterized protein LOC108556599 [Nicrophorus vespilloides]
MSDWSTQDKALLLKALRKHGSDKIEAIANEIPLKSIFDVKNMIIRYERLASYDPNEKLDNTSPIDLWIQALRKHTDYNELVPISKALKFISMYEENNNEYINISDCYEILANISEGVAGKELDQSSYNFVLNSFLNTAKEVKSEKTAEEKQFLSNVKVTNNDLSKKNTYSAKAKRVAEDTTVNPLCLPKELCQKKRKVNDS